jgi:hypothetical protein
MFRNGEILVQQEDLQAAGHDTSLLDTPQVFAVVNHEKYDEHPIFRQRLEEFDELDQTELVQAIGLSDGLGFGENYDTRWGDHDGLNLQMRAHKVVMID